MNAIVLLLASWVVVTGEKPAPEIAYAASEFTNAVVRCTGEALDVAATAPKGARSVVSIRAKGPNAADQDERLGYRSSEGRLEIVGNQPRAALHATFQYLQRELGVRWLWPGETGAFYPERKGFDVPAGLRYAHRPTIRYRGFHLCGQGAVRPLAYEWIARNGMVMHWDGVRGDERRFGFYNCSGAHNACIDPRLMGEHPDWFSEFNGQRKAYNVCWQSEGAFRKILEQLDQEAKGKDILGIFPADNQNYCRCAECAKRSVSDNWFRYFNRLVDELGRRHPGQLYSTLAYQGYRRAPTDVVPKAAFVEFATHGRCHAHGYGACPDNAAEAAKLDAWYKVGVPMGEYTYEFDVFDHSTLWVPLFSMVDDDLTHAAVHGHVVQIPELGVGGKGLGFKAIGAFRNRFVAHFIMQKTFDADVRLDDWMADTCRTAFGPAGAAVEEYFKVMDRAWTSQKGHPGILIPVLLWVNSLMTPATVEAAEAALRKAEAAVGSAPARYRENVADVRAEFEAWKAESARRNDTSFTADPDHTLLYFAGSPRHVMYELPVERSVARQAGWNFLVCTNAAQVAEALPKANAVWFRMADPRQFDAATLEKVRAKVRAGAVWFFTGFGNPLLEKMTGDATIGAEKVASAELPAPLRHPTFVRGGQWNAWPNDLVGRSYGMNAPSYLVRGKGEGWRTYLKCRAKDGETPFLSTHRFGKGLIVLSGERLGIPWCKLLENLRAEELSDEFHQQVVERILKTAEPLDRNALRTFLSAAAKKKEFAVCEIASADEAYVDAFDRARKDVGLDPGRILLVSADLAALKGFRKRYPAYAAGWLGCGVGEAKFDVDKAIAAAKAAGCRVFWPFAEDAVKRLKPSDAEKVREAGLDFRLAGVDSPQALKKSRELRAAVIVKGKR